jgi:hypothetical protein
MEESKAPESLEAQAKSVFQSRTFWAAVLMAVAPVIPPVGALVAAYPDIAGLLAGLVTAGLRMATDKPVTVKRKAKVY